jgi:hypothetical protein
VNTAVIGWGSLIWCPGCLRTKTKWRSDGPRLPIEFARISRDGRLTLVIVPGSDEQPTYWALSEFGILEDAHQNLQKREDTGPEDVHYLTAGGQVAGGVPPPVVERLRDWLAAKPDIDAAIWTGLPSNWREKRGCEFSPGDAVRYLNELESERERAATTYDRAREYVCNTPSHVQTLVRRAMQRLGWRDKELPTVLFDG